MHCSALDSIHVNFELFPHGKISLADHNFTLGNVVNSVCLHFEVLIPLPAEITHGLPSFSLHVYLICFYL